MSRQLVILCGGKGTRIASVTGGTSQKCLLPVAGRPFLSHVLDVAEAWRVSEVLLLAGHRGDEVAAFAAGLGLRGYRLSCHIEQCPLGTVGSVRAVADRLDAAFLVALGDVLPPADPDMWQRMFAVLDRSGAAAVLASADEQESMDQGNLQVEGDLVLRYDRSRPAPLIDRGVRLLSRAGLDSAAGDSDSDYFGASGGRPAARALPDSRPGARHRNTGAAGPGPASLDSRPGGPAGRKETRDAMSIESITELHAEARAAADRVDLARVAAAVDLLCEVRRTQGVVLAAGNGGSSSTASHFAADLTKFARVAGLPHLRSVALADNVACHTAWTNDDDPARSAMHLAEPWLQPDGTDRRHAVVLFSVHGGARDGSVSNNLVELARYAGRMGASVIALTGFDGGMLGEIADVHLNVPMASEPMATPGVESVHLLLAHALCLGVRKKEHIE